MHTKTEEFISKAKKVHGDLYDYSEVVYVNSKHKVVIICKEHGPFEQIPANHLSGARCKKCFEETKGSSQRLTNEDFVMRAKAIHGNRYDYSKVNYINRITPVTIICKEHGEFEQVAGYHIGKSKSGCPKCGKEVSRLKRRSTTKDFITKAQEIHGDTYSYDRSLYTGANEPIIITCNIHGDFQQRAADHLSGFGCIECGGRATITTEEFISRSKERYQNKFSYRYTEYINMNESTTLYCNKHKIAFEVTPWLHLNRGIECPKCKPKSKEEEDLRDFIRSVYSGTVLPKGVTNIIPPYELDIYLPEAKLAIEYHGIHYHSERLKVDKFYHQSKYIKAKEAGVQLLSIFSDEWLTSRSKVESIIKNKLGVTEHKIYARKCKIVEIKSKIANKFMEENHIQGRGLNKYNLALTYNDEIVAVMIISRHHRDSTLYSLNRFATKLNTNVVGGASKLFKYFTDNYDIDEIKSSSDNRWSDGKLYEILGFEHTRDQPVSYTYVVGNKRHNPQKYNKKRIGATGKDTTEHAFLAEREIYRIWDCGKKNWVWKRAAN